MFGRVAASALAWGFAALLVRLAGSLRRRVERIRRSGRAARRHIDVDVGGPHRTQAPASDETNPRAPQELPRPPKRRDPPHAPPAAAGGAVRSYAVPVAGGDISTKWSGIAADIRAESEILARCRANVEACPAAAQNFLAIVDKAAR